jgi:hypothetical protein
MCWVCNNLALPGILCQNARQRLISVVVLRLNFEATSIALPLQRWRVCSQPTKRYRAQFIPKKMVQRARHHLQSTQRAYHAVRCIHATLLAVCCCAWAAAVVIPGGEPAQAAALLASRDIGDAMPRTCAATACPLCTATASSQGMAQQAVPASQDSGQHAAPFVRHTRPRAISRLLSIDPGCQQVN